MWDVLIVAWSGCGMLGIWDVWDLGCSELGCWECGMFQMWESWDVECLGCWILGLCNVRDMGCLRCGMFGKCDVPDVGC